MPEPKASVLIQLIDKTSKPLNAIRGKLKAFGSGVVSVATKVTALGAGMAGLGGVFLSAAGKVEQWRVRFETMAGSAEKGQKTLEDLTELASKSPFDMPQVVEGAARLNAMGFEADELTDRMRMLGDITAGVGTEKMPQLVLAFGQVKTAGKLTGQELRQFNEAGVDLLGGLAENLGKTKAEIKDMVSEGKIGFDDVDQTLKNMTSSGGQFFGLMDKLSGTFLGKVSNIKDNLFQMSVAIGDELLPEVSKLTDGVADFTENEKNIIKISGRIQDVILFVKSLIVWFKNAGDTITQWYLVSENAVNNLKLGFENLWLAIELGLQSFVTGSVETINGWINTIIGGVNKITSRFGKSFDEIDLKQTQFYKNMMAVSDESVNHIEDSIDSLTEKQKENQRKILELEVDKTKRVNDLNDHILEKAEENAAKRAEAEKKANEEIIESSAEAASETENSFIDAFLSMASSGMSSIGAIKKGMDEIKKHAKDAAELLDSLIFGGSLEDKVLKAERDFARKKRDIEKEFARGEIGSAERLKQLRDATEDYTDKISDLREESLEASKVKVSDVLDPAKAAARITDANNSLSRTKYILNDIKTDAQDYHATMKGVVSEVEREQEAKEAAEKAAREAEKAAREETRRYEAQQRLIDGNIQKLDRYTTKKEDILLGLSRGISDLGPGAEAADYQRLALSAARGIQDLSIGLSRSGIDVGATESTADDTLIMSIAKTLQDLNKQLSNLSVNVDVSQVSAGLTKTIDQYQTLNEKGRI